MELYGRIDVDERMHAILNLRSWIALARSTPFSFLFHIIILSSVLFSCHPDTFTIRYWVHDSPACGFEGAGENLSQLSFRVRDARECSCSQKFACDSFS